MGSTAGTAPTFALLDDGLGVEVVDPVEQRRIVLSSAVVADLETGCDDAFRLPVDSVAAVRATGFRLEGGTLIVVRDCRGEIVTEVQPMTDAELPAGEYEIELNGPIKLCLGVESPVTVSSSGKETAVEFPEPRRVHLGARSYHRRPAATITTTGDLEAMAVAVSTLGSALKTTTPERAYPTLRGHPPAIELGDETRIPPALARPDTGVTIEAPATCGALYAAAPLAYYLGAEVVLGDRPRIATDAGFDYPLGGGSDGIERAFERALKQTFFLDCLTRTEGLYEIPLHERAAVEPHVDLAFDRLYEEPLARQLEAYLEVDYEVIEPHLPTWNVIAHVPPTPDRIEVLPAAIDTLALVRPADAGTVSSSDVRTAILADYVDETTRASPTTDRARADRPVGDGGSAERIVQLAQTESMEDAWYGEGAPLNATKALPRAYRNRLDRSAGELPIDIAVVCNDTELEAESTITDAVYGSRAELPFDVTLHRNLSTAALRSVLTSDVDFLHYIGHTARDGFRCRDGRLDAATLDAIDLGAFFLNSCRSYRQGLHLIEAGSIGGVVTLSDVNDAGAATVGRTMARLLNRGFPLRAAHRLAAGTSVVGGHYVVIGDGTADVTSGEGTIPLVCRLEVADGDRYDATFEVFLPREGGMGTTVYPFLEANDEYFLAPGDVATFRISREGLRDYLTWHPVPVLFRGELILSGWFDRLEL